MPAPRIKLEVLGITFSQIQAGAYALILGEESGSRRIPVIIGTPEAQSIAIFLEGLHPPRPLTHDMFVTFMKRFDVELKEVVIYKFEEGVFFSEIHFEGSKSVVIDARTSDAIALAIRCKAPIYTTPEIMTEAGVMMEESEFETPDDDIYPFEHGDQNYEEKTMEELQSQLDDAIIAEDYEAASKIRDEIKKRTGGKQ